MTPSIMDLWGYLLASWKIDRLSENSRKREENLNQEGFTVVLENVRATGSVVTIQEIIYVQMVGDIILCCDELRTPCVIARELAFPFRENKDCHDAVVTKVAPQTQRESNLPDTKDFEWNDGLQELVREHRERNRKNL